MKLKLCCWDVITHVACFLTQRQRVLNKIPTGKILCLSEKHFQGQRATGNKGDPVWAASTFEGALKKKDWKLHDGQTTECSSNCSCVVPVDVVINFKSAVLHPHPGKAAAKTVTGQASGHHGKRASKARHCTLNQTSRTQHWVSNIRKENGRQPSEPLILHINEEITNTPSFQKQ